MKRIALFLKRITVTAVVLAIVVGCPLAVWKGWPAWEQWYRDSLASKLAQQIETSEDREAKVLVHQLASLGAPAYEELMEATVSSRAPVAETAQTEIDLILAGHRTRISRKNRKQDAADVVVLSRALAANATNFGPDGARWAETLALQLIELADHLTISQTAKVLGYTSNVLETIPPQGPRLRTVQASVRTVENTDVMELPPAEIDLDLLKVPSESAIVEEAPNSTSAVPIPKVEELPIVEKKDKAASVRPLPRQEDRNVKQLPWISAGRSSISVDVAPPPAKSSDERLLIVPTPQQMEQRLHALRKRPTETLVEKLPHADRFMASTIRIVLTERGLSEEEIELGRRVSAPDVNVRLQLIEEISQLPSVSARRLLRLLLQDNNADIRLRALTTLATTGDPQLSELARQIAVQDDDPRVADLASRLMRK